MLLEMLEAVVETCGPMSSSSDTSPTVFSPARARW